MMIKLELFRQFQQYQEDLKTQKDGERRKISFGNILLDMKVVGFVIVRVCVRLVYQIQFNKGFDNDYS